MKKYSLPDEQIIKLAWGILRHYIPVEIQKMLIDEIKKIQIEHKPKQEPTPEKKQVSFSDIRKPKANQIPRPKCCADIASFFGKK
ncbi:hypothetical protein TVAG_380040 [Trichomonas vaginalis G3]|uniref:Uncharacterized protein n=1 Tax=Trichomonas vaginalis (strain ATCC PRA-98 / G3) TaxID=412133 RepID=A2DXE2_TRIV3|nr:hypothetical protein TVAGG3_0925580 [Trichomonas vaginalis G3]EAY14894.1 hypothetical protein TVAG_380040 [Trichomonas vaginalis G3]KAI5485447.1 hypothetical protein TVAGG3_0925580 [Trichomonas vaginalis G3]|eukprot:XP_001327117.1 hypothetical protein [Trichomonas vaginalis G3]